MMKPASKTALKLLAGIAVSIVCLYFALRGINPDSLLRIIKTVRIPYLVLFSLILLGSVSLRAFVYYHFLKRQNRDVSFFTIFEGLIIGYMVNSIFPMRAGDIAKAYVIGKLNRVSKTYTFILAVIERLFDLINLLLFFLVLLSVVPLDNAFKTAARMLSIVIGAALLVIIGVITCSDRLIAMVRKSSLKEDTRERISSRLGMVRDGFRILCRWQDILFIELVFLLIWGSYLVVCQVSGLAVNINLTLIMALFLVVAVSFGTAVVSSPGGLGVHQYASVLVFAYFGMSREEALSFSLVNNTLSVITPVLLGWIFLVHTNLSLASLQGELQAGAPQSDQNNEEGKPPAGEK